MSSPSSIDLSLSAISKMKVAELKRELKAKGLSPIGTKPELVERLHSSSSTGVSDILSEDGNAESEILDEDEVLAGEEGNVDFDDDDDLAAEAVLADEPKPKAPISVSLAPKRSVPHAAEETEQAQPKKRLLIRPISTLTTRQENGSQKKTTDMEVEEEKSEKKILKLSGVSVKDRLELRAQKFGVPLSEAAKKEARAVRFGTSSTVSATVTPTVSIPSGIATSTKITILGPSEDVLKKRAERFGGNVSSITLKAEAQDKMKKRQERFATMDAVTVSADEKKTLRAKKFKL